MRRVHVLGAAVLLAVLVPLAGPAAAAAPVGPQPPQVRLTQVSLSCTGDTLHGLVTVDSEVPLDVTAVLRVQDAQGRHAATDRTDTFAVAAGGARYSFALDAGGLPPTADSYRVELSALGTVRGTGVVRVSRCAPPAVVPEVPAALLVPLSLGLTSALVLAVHRRRARA